MRLLYNYNYQTSEFQQIQVQATLFFSFNIFLGEDRNS